MARCGGHYGSASGGINPTTSGQGEWYITDFGQGSTTDNPFGGPDKDRSGNCLDYRELSDGESRWQGVAYSLGWWASGDI